MIRLHRTRATPPINSKFTGTKLEGTSIKLLKDQRSIRKGELEKHKFDSGVWKQAKEQLLFETSDKCAYCETPTAVVTYGDVEHYRPKSKYWWLAYCLDNYLASCAICNQKFKKDHFRIKHQKLKAPRVRSNSTDNFLGNLASSIVPDPIDLAAVGDFDDLHEVERPLLVNPYVDDPADYHAWRTDENIGEVELIPNPNHPDSETFVSAAEEIYGLNRPQLRTYRYVVFRHYRLYRKMLAQAGLPADLRTEISQQIQNMTNSDQSYAGMIRFYENHGGPDDWEQDGFLIPTP